MFELVLRVSLPLVEAVSDALIEQLGALSVSVEDADAGAAGEEALFGEPDMPVQPEGWRQSTLNALFADQTLAASAATALLVLDSDDELTVQGMHSVPDQDWVRLTQSQFAPVAISPGFWVVPSWHQPPAGATRVIRLDPGLAFGTGTHPTTHMCLAWLARHAYLLGAPGARVLDYGCGSGILAIAAALHGARDIDAVDIDPVAVQATEHNARANGASLRSGLPECIAGRYSVVLANILATPLKLLAPLLIERLADDGQLVLAGILERQASELQAAYEPALALQVSDARDGWILMTAQRRAASTVLP